MDVSNYSKKVIEKLTSDWSSKKMISGEEILTFSNIKQLNLMIIQNILINWKIQLRNLKSPYFNFKNNEVQQAYVAFGNILSRHISISKNDFVDLAERSCEQTLLLINSPYEYFNELILREELKGLTLSDFQEACKYIKINHQVVEELIIELNKKDLSDVYGKNAVLDQVFENMKTLPESTEKYISQFNEIIPREESKKPEHPEVFAQTVEEEVSISKTTILTSTEEKVTLNDRFQQPQKESLADIHQKKKIVNLKTSLSLNQKFMFIQHLFEGKSSEFEQVLDQIDQFSTLSEAKSYLSNQFQWDIESEEAQEFFELIDKKFTQK